MKISDPTPTQKTLTEKPQKENHTTDKSLTPRQQYEQLRQERYTLMTDKKILQPENQERYRQIKKQMNKIQQQLKE